MPEQNELDQLFLSYNYRVSEKSNDHVRIYTLRYGMYHAAEILVLDNNTNAESIKAEFSSLGYATEIKKLSDNLDLEEYLFEGFFIKTPLGNELKHRYKTFEKKQLQNLPEGSKYKYIEGPYDLLFQDPSGTVVENKSYDGTGNQNIIEKINSILTKTSSATFIIIEAAAGFGKTCTANEILNRFSSEKSKRLPFYTELSRNREARVFKHILLNEIDEQFPTGIKQNIVIDQIIKGRIPLVIDGFDELITKESNREEIESMLTTIVELLKGDAKIIITSRKTAIFNSDEFLETLNKTEETFALARFEIKEPTIENWLNSERIELIQSAGFPVEQIANPVLLSYLRNVPLETLKTDLNEATEETLINKYIEYLLKRERVRQNLKFDKDTQLRIFRKLVRFMTEYDFTAESKETIKEFIKSYNLKILHKSLSDYQAEEKPSLDDLVETLSNHAFLDRKASGNIGFVNDLIFGLLVGENLIYEKYQEYYPDDYQEILSQNFAKKAIQAFKIQSKDNKQRLWNIFNSSSFTYDVDFFFNLDCSIAKCLQREYRNLVVNDDEFKNLTFCNPASFFDSIFSNVTFKSCRFDPSVFITCSFVNCTFYDCEIEDIEEVPELNNFRLFACQSNNSFTSIFDALASDEESDSEHQLTETMVLREFFGIGMKKPRPRKLTYIKEHFAHFPYKDLGKIISSLKHKEYVYFKDDVGLISKEGIHFFNLHKSEL